MKQTDRKQVQFALAIGVVLFGCFIAAMAVIFLSYLTRPHPPVPAGTVVIYAMGGWLGDPFQTTRKIGIHHRRGHRERSFLKFFTALFLGVALFLLIVQMWLFYHPPVP